MSVAPLQVTSTHGFFSRAAGGVSGLRRGQQQRQQRQGEGQGMGGHVVSMSELDKAANVQRFVRRRKSLLLLCLRLC